MTEIPKRVDKPWGHEVWWARTERYVGKLLHVKKGESLSLQYHRVKDETIRAGGRGAPRGPLRPRRNLEALIRRFLQ